MALCEQEFRIIVPVIFKSKKIMIIFHCILLIVAVAMFNAMADFGQQVSKMRIAGSVVFVAIPFGFAALNSTHPYFCWGVTAIATIVFWGWSKMPPPLLSVLDMVLKEFLFWNERGIQFVGPNIGRAKVVGIAPSYGNPMLYIITISKPSKPVTVDRQQVLDCGVSDAEIIRRFQ